LGGGRTLSRKKGVKTPRTQLEKCIGSADGKRVREYPKKLEKKKRGEWGCRPKNYCWPCALSDLRHMAGWHQEGERPKRLNEGGLPKQLDPGSMIGFASPQKRKRGKGKKVHNG